MDHYWKKRGGGGTGAPSFLLSLSLSLSPPPLSVSLFLHPQVIHEQCKREEKGGGGYSTQSGARTDGQKCTKKWIKSTLEYFTLLDPSSKVPLSCRADNTSTNFEGSFGKANAFLFHGYFLLHQTKTQSRNICGQARHP